MHHGNSQHPVFLGQMGYFVDSSYRKAGHPLIRLHQLALFAWERMLLARKNQGALTRWRDAQSNTEMADHILKHNVPSDVTSGQREVCQEVFERLDTMYCRRTQYNEFGERAAKAYPEVVDLALEGMSDDLALMKLGLHEFTDERRSELETRCQTADASPDSPGRTEKNISTSPCRLHRNDPL